MIMSITSKDTVSSKKENRQTIFTKYLDYCDSQQSQYIVWFLIPLMSLSAAVMPAGFVIMSAYETYMLYVAISVPLFFANIIVNVAEQSTRVTISLYLCTLLFHILFPIISMILA